MQASPPRNVPSPLVHPLDDNRRVVGLIAAVTQEPSAVVAEQLWQEEHDLGKYHREEFRRRGLAPHAWGEGLERYYREVSAWLPAYVVWNRRPEKLQMRTWMGRYLSREASSRLRVLTIGDGAGFDSLYLAQCGHDVTYFEVSAHAVDFARRLFDLSQQTIQVVRDTSAIPAEHYDAVVCLDVLEHVPDPRVLVAEMTGFLRPGGQLIVHAPFFLVNEDCPTHLECNRKYSGDLRRLYRSQGLRPVDARFFWNPLVLEKLSPQAAPRQRNWIRLLRLHLAGLLLAVGRVWPWPHNWVANRTRRCGDPRWRVRTGTL